MRTLLRLCMVVALACAPAFAPSAASAAGGPRVLAVTTGNEAQDVADYALERLQMEARRWNFTLIEGTAEDVKQLGEYDVIMFLNTGGDFLDDDQQDAVETFVEQGGGLITTNTAIEAEPDWAWYHETLGATALPRAEAATEEPVEFNSGSQITEGLDDELKLTERWYYFEPAPAQPGSTVLATLTAGGGAVSWVNESLPVFYASPGGEGKTWGDRDFLQLIRQAIWWGAGNDAAMVQNSDDAAPSWPYTLTFVLFVVAVAGGGSIAVWRLDKAETEKETAEA
ncbi:ThuA domain-containing protein [Glycomyces sp. NPDC048151]|uniref:ThuA domain-containing protein n=1 Tax=Glycomyces sp. NPDC048151 TaxID=3364002 RepID=UPI00371758F1